MLFFRTKICLHIWKILQCGIKPQDLQYYTQMVITHQSIMPCGKLVGCPTYHKRITIWHLCKQQNYPMECHICCGILLSASYIVLLYHYHFHVHYGYRYMSCWKAWATSQLKLAAYLRGHKKLNKLARLWKKINFKKGE